MLRCAAALGSVACSPGPLAMFGERAFELLEGKLNGRGSFSLTSARATPGAAPCSGLRSLSAASARRGLLSFEQHPQGRCKRVRPQAVLVSDALNRTLRVNKMKPPLMPPRAAGGPEVATPGANRENNVRRQHQTRPVPPQNLDPVQALGAKHHDRPEKGSRPSSCSTSAARASCPLPLHRNASTIRGADPEQSSLAAPRRSPRSAKRRYPRQGAPRASIDTEPTEPGPGVASTSSAAKAGSDLDAATLGSTSALRAAKVRAAGAAGSSSVAGEDGEVSLPRRARARQAFT